MFHPFDLETYEHLGSVALTFSHGARQWIVERGGAFSEQRRRCIREASAGADKHGPPHRIVVEAAVDIIRSTRRFCADGPCFGDCDMRGAGQIECYDSEQYCFGERHCTYI